tara:strand:- start:396 stop:1226 length:831 start_codon:yes stop_codon:yes gene_type:complete
MPCGIDFNLSSFKDGIISQASGLIGLAGTIGTPFGVLANITKVQSTVALMKGNLLSMLPIGALGDIAALAEGGLRGQLGALADLVPNSSAALSKITDIASEFSGISNLSGFANIDLNNITNSVFSVSGTFDPCSISIPNVFTDAAGSLQSLASSVPKIGATDLAKNTSEIQKATSGLFSSFTDNVDLGFNLGEFTTDLPNISSITNSFTNEATGLAKSLNPGEISNTLANLTKNISPAITGMSDMIQKLPDGSQILRTKSALIESLKQNQSLYTEV